MRASAAWLVVAACYTGTTTPPPGPPLDRPPARFALEVRMPTIAAGSFHSCAIDREHHVWCWGHGLKGQTGPAGDHLTPVETSVDDALAVAAGEWFTCVLRRNGAVTCFGENTEHQLDAPRERALEIGVGARFGCAHLHGGSVKCWGQTSGEPPSAGVVRLAVGDHHACALMDDRSIRCWGGDNLGQNGAVAGLADVVDIAAGGVNTCALTKAGTVWCWGDTAFGALGSGSTSMNHTSHPQPIEVPGVRDARSIVVGSGRACAIVRGGAVMCWGTNYMGALGLENVAEAPPTMLPGIDRPIAELAIGGRHTCARASDGSVMCWGANYWGELGAGPVGSRWYPEGVAIGNEPAAQIAHVGQPPPPPPNKVATKPTPAKITTTTAGARRVEVTLDSEASLTAAGWHRNAGGQSTFPNGKLVLHAQGFEEWQQTNDFVVNAGNPPGWAVEAKLSLDSPCAKTGTGLWIHDGLHHMKVKISDHELAIEPNGIKKPIGPTNTPRVYRIELVGTQLTIKVDGTDVISSTPMVQGASKVLMFGTLGDGCGNEVSTWDYIAYETFPLPPSQWPHDEWHPGTRRDPLVAALAPVPRAAAAVGAKVAGDDVACIAIAAVDGAVRDVLPLEFAAQKSADAATAMRTLPPLVSARAREDAARILADWTEPKYGPICDPAPGQRCGPNTPTLRAQLPPGGARIREALEHASAWGEHPSYAEQATHAAAEAYADALARKVPGAAAAVDRLVKRLETIQRAGGTCGL